MVKGITIVLLAMMFLDLDDCLDALRTEGSLVSSGTARYHSWYQGRLISLDYLAQALG